MAELNIAIKHGQDDFFIDARAVSTVWPCLMAMFSSAIDFT